uniref:Uncharacterized protein n=1 Tax=Arundo donax TaxID=35708 RepID=A0A0A9FWK9_ARUDO
MLGPVFRCCQTSPAMPSVLRAASLNFFPTMPNISLKFSLAPAVTNPQMPPNQDHNHQSTKQPIEPNTRRT